MLNGDDYMIEYCERLMIALKQNYETLLKPQWKTYLENFFITPLSDDPVALMNPANSTFKPTYLAKMDHRVQEMRERRKRHLKIMFKREGRLSDFEHGFKNLI